MADSEVDKLREERGIRGLRKAMRKGKGKARQVEEDEGMVNSDTSESDKAEEFNDSENRFDDGDLSDIDGDINFYKDDEDEVIEAEAVHPYITPDLNCC